MFESTIRSSIVWICRSICLKVALKRLVASHGTRQPRIPEMSRIHGLCRYGKSPLNGSSGLEQPFEVFFELVAPEIDLGDSSHSPWSCIGSRDASCRLLLVDQHAVSAVPQSLQWDEATQREVCADITYAQAAFAVWSSGGSWISLVTGCSSNPTPSFACPLADAHAPNPHAPHHIQRILAHASGRS